MAVAVEGAAEGLVVVVGLVVARHGSHADVVGQLHVLAAVVAAVGDVVGELVPVVGAADEVGVCIGAGALRGPVLVEDKLGGDVFALHDELKTCRVSGLPVPQAKGAVGIGDGDARHRARRHVQREGCIGVRPRHV